MNKIENNALKKNFNEWAILSIINNTKNDEKPVLGWKIVAGKKVTVDVVFQVIRKFRNEVVVRAVGSRGKSTLGDLASGAQKLNFYLPDDMVLFQADVKQIELNGDVRITMPQMIAQIDRRKYLRLFVEETMNVKVKFLKENHGHSKITQKFEKNCFDISAGGFSFVIAKSESRFFYNCDSIFGIEMQIGKEKINIAADVINVLDIEPNEENKLHYKGQKVCVQYSNISKESKSLINNYVFKYVEISEAI